MRLKVFFYVLAILILLIFGLVFDLCAGIRSTEFFVVECLIIIVLAYIGYFYRQVVRPLTSIANGMDLLKEQDFSSRLRSVGQYEADKVIAIFNRMMEQLKNERLRLREQNNFLDLLIKASPIGVIVLNFDKEISSINPAALRMLEISESQEVLGEKVAILKELSEIDLMSISPNSSVVMRLNNSSVYRCVHSFLVDQGFQRSFFLIESLTSEVEQIEKEAYEKVVRMISHEVNNTTAGITSTLDSILYALQETGQDGEFRDVMTACIDRCYGMSRFVANFADVIKLQKIDPSVADINDILTSSIRLLESFCNGAGVTIHYIPDRDFPKVIVDTALMQQVFLNIIKNSVESIISNGDIYITIDPINSSLTIADNGRGIDGNTEKELFTPFFSSKPNGQGLGLLFIKEVLNRHGCRFSLRTDVDGLTRFVINISSCIYLQNKAYKYGN